ncbi:unnamed protein product [Triticum turgidum subsp. durum]|uniref:RRM domain-containing protein n=1 Tax=Triticum turgidum subsp. durum TaxID=4567 RepID=A0A9R0X3H9_TRITD|nr:unnamed protein product [Triticum turgidum subsp. durum]
MTLGCSETGWKMTVFKCNKSLVHAEQKGIRALGILGLTLQGISLKGFGGGFLSNDNSRVITRSSHQLMVEGLHAFVEYETHEDAEKAILELNDERNWRNGLRSRLLNTCMTKGPVKGKTGGHEGDGNGEDDVSTSNQSNERQLEGSFQLADVLPEHLFDENSDKQGPKHGKGRGCCGKGRGRGYHQLNNYHHHIHNGSNHHQVINSRGSHPVGTPPNTQLIMVEQLLPVANKQPPGPRMPDGTRGFAMGRGKPSSASCAVEL